MLCLRIDGRVHGGTIIPVVLKNLRPNANKIGGAVATFGPKSKGLRRCSSAPAIWQREKVTRPALRGYRAVCTHFEAGSVNEQPLEIFVDLCQVHDRHRVIIGVCLQRHNVCSSESHPSGRSREKRPTLEVPISLLKLVSYTPN